MAEHIYFDVIFNKMTTSDAPGWVDVYSLCGISLVDSSEGDAGCWLSTAIQESNPFKFYEEAAGFSEGYIMQHEICDSCSLLLITVKQCYNEVMREGPEISPSQGSYP